MDKVEAEDRITISVRVNGEPKSASTTTRQSLVDFLRHGLGLTGSHVGCEHGVCGACNVIVDDSVVRGCLMLAIQADGARITTIDAANPGPEVAALQKAFFERAALQCGFCTPGMIMQASELLQRNESPTREEIREVLSGNYCRCTGYHAIIDAVQAASKALIATKR
ncbi:(2Fe-2S)-binding protein [Bradyrhizobium sp. SYSU BS000235]|uniref:(2Fe-2S)-binding protein n=1 Tax=Bradyrhizobium sp. SYSU BS000235 TaxID=3411332 RepID=UPI003C74598B